MIGGGKRVPLKRDQTGKRLLPPHDGWMLNDYLSATTCRDKKSSFLRSYLAFLEQLKGN
ncbi:hypothetical protein J6590_101929, partial [Homalodisca vitripennis]